LRLGVEGGGCPLGEVAKFSTADGASRREILPKLQDGGIVGRIPPYSIFRRTGMSRSALNIKNPEAVRLARELAAKTGESVTQAVTNAVRERLHALERREERTGSTASIRRIQAFVASLPERDGRTAEEIIGYDEFGIPG
jgi:antitoxin VapB